MRQNESKRQKKSDRVSQWSRSETDNLSEVRKRTPERNRANKTGMKVMIVSDTHRKVPKVKSRGRLSKTQNDSDETQMNK